MKVGEYINHATYLARIVEHVHTGGRQFLSHVHPSQYREGVFHQCGGTFGTLTLTGHVGERSGHFLVGDAEIVGTGDQVRHVAGEVCKFTRAHTFGGKEGVQYLSRRRILLAHDGKCLRQCRRNGIEVGKARLASLQGGIQDGQ